MANRALVGRRRLHFLGASLARSYFIAAAVFFLLSSSFPSSQGRKETRLKNAAGIGIDNTPPPPPLLHFTRNRNFCLRFGLLKLAALGRIYRIARQTGKKEKTCLVVVEEEGETLSPFLPLPIFWWKGGRRREKEEKRTGRERSDREGKRREEGRKKERAEQKQFEDNSTVERRRGDGRSAADPFAGSPPSSFVWKGGLLLLACCLGVAPSFPSFSSLSINDVCGEKGTDRLRCCLDVTRRRVSQRVMYFPEQEGGEGGCLRAGRRPREERGRCFFFDA